eukprot:m.65961 g.65961  ORF g.65961 m.65961 type:complete len:531 (+) comp8326_c0_seq3:2559-4151(+)
MLAVHFFSFAFFFPFAIYIFLGMGSFVSSSYTSSLLFGWVFGTGINVRPSQRCWLHVQEFMARACCPFSGTKLVSALPQVEHTQLNDSEQAISACSDFKYSLIFMDLDSEFTSSVRTGVDAVRNIRWADNGVNRQTPVIGLTLDESMAGQMASYGVDDILLKPFNKEMLAAVVQKWLGGVADILALGGDDTPSLDISRMAPPDFIISGLVKPKTARVLVVEDCKLTQHVIIGLLSKLTDNVSQAFDGEQAVEMCQRHQFDLILMDMAMPKLNGLEATRRIRTSGKNMYAPIVAFTSSGTLSDYRAFGVNDMLQKPFTKEMLSNIFDKWTAYIKQLDDNLPDTTLLGGEDTMGMENNTSVVMGGEGDTMLAAGAAPPPLPSMRMDGGGGGGAREGGGTAGGTGVSAPQQQAAKLLKPPQPNKQAYQPLGLGLPMPNLPFNNRGAGKTGSGRRKKGAPRIIHNRKEQQRRKQITLAADELSKIIPNLPAGDKATVLMSTVEYVQMLRASIPSDTLQELDTKFQPSSLSLDCD